MGTQQKEEQKYYCMWRTRLIRGRSFIEMFVRMMRCTMMYQVISIEDETKVKNQNIERNVT